MTSQTLKPGWRMVRFGEVVKNANLVERNPAANGIERVVGLDHIDPENLHIRRWNSPEDGTSFTRKFIPGQTLFGKRRAYQRKVAYAEFEGICSGDILTFESKNNKILLPELLPFICQSDRFFEFALGTSAGSLSPRTSWKALKDFEFALPPLEEQKRIAEILWTADEAVVTYRELLNNFDTFIKCQVEETLNSLQCKKIDMPKVLAKNPESGCSAPPSPHETGHWVLSLAALSASGYIKGCLKPVNKTNKMLNAMLSKGDFLISRSNTIDLVGLVGIFDEDRSDISFPDTMMRLSVNTKLILSQYLEIVILSNRGRMHMMKTASGTSNSMKKINRKTLNEFRFPLPDLEVQEQIISNLSRLKSRRKAINDHLLKIREMLFKFNNEEIGSAQI